MVGLIGLCQRVFAALASKNINLILVSQASSECTLTIGVSEVDSEKAQKEMPGGQVIDICLNGVYKRT
jgi:aspartokinase/homoserine dehydrogenase 1